LASVIGFVHERAPGLATAATVEAEAPPAAAEPGGELTAPAHLGDDDAARSIERRIAAAVLRPSIEHCVITAVELGEGARVVVMLDDGGVGTALVDRLQKRGVDVLAIEGAPAADDLLASIDDWRGDADVTGIYWLPALDVEPAVAETGGARVCGAASSCSPTSSVISTTCWANRITS
jgi:hypothetical protein